MPFSSLKRSAGHALGVAVFAAFCALPTLPLPAQSLPGETLSALHEKFLAPSPDARPMMRWWWFGPAVEKGELASELETMQKAGIGGVEIQPVYPMALDDPAHGIRNLKYLSPEFLDAITFTNRKARSLGLRVDLTLGSGWPYGGPNTSLALAACKLKVEFVPVEGSQVAPPRLGEGERLIAAFLAAGTREKFDAAAARRFDPAVALPAGSGPRVALYFVEGHTRQMVKRASYGAEGFVLDHMSRAAIDEHLKDVAEPLLKAFGSEPPYAVFSDSLEVYDADWTPTLPEEFLRRRGYDLIAHLPELVAGSTPEAEAIRHDWGVTMSDLVRENYLAPVTRFAQEHGTRFRSQTYGFPPAILADQAIPALPEGEGPQWRRFSFTRWASSANHLYGNNVTSAETWTWLHSPVFRATPLDMKVEADRMFLEGVNQFVGHGWPYSPKAAGEPGWSLYAAAVFNQHNPWFDVMPDITAYLTRISWLLRQGKPANDIAILLPEDDAQSTFTPLSGRVSITEQMKNLISPELMAALLDAGYNIDYIDARTIEKLGAIPYPVLLLPPTRHMPLATYQAIAAYAGGQGRLLALGAQARLAPGLKSSADSPAVAALTAQLFDAPGHKGIAVASIEALPAALHAALVPDLDARPAEPTGKIEELGFIHRKLDAADVYYVVNSGNKPIDATVAFRSARPALEAWEPDSGKLLFAARNAAGQRFPLSLAPYESRVFVLGTPGAEALGGAPAPAAEKPLADLNSGWTLRFDDEKMDTDLDRLRSWTEIEGRKYFSGRVTYSRAFNLDAAALRSARLFIDFGAGTPTTDPRPAGVNGLRALLDPPVREAAIVTVNGKRIGSLWHPPYRLDLTPVLHPGKNLIEITVSNTAMNLMAGQPPRDFGPLYAKYGKRFEMQELDQVAPLPSGLLGSVQILAVAN